MRKASPKKFDSRSFRVKTVSKKTKIIVACPKGQFKKGKCQVGMKLQSVLKRRK